MTRTPQVALVTGGGTGIGRSISLMLAERGVDVAINYSRSRASAEETAQEVEASGARAMTVQADVSDDDQVKAMVAEVVARFGRLDVLVNNAGATTFVPLADLDALQKEHWNQVFNINVEGAFYCSRAATPTCAVAGKARSSTLPPSQASAGGVVRSPTQHPKPP